MKLFGMPTWPMKRFKRALYNNNDFLNCPLVHLYRVEFYEWRVWRLIWNCCCCLRPHHFPEH